MAIQEWPCLRRSLAPFAALALAFLLTGCKTPPSRQAVLDDKASQGPIRKVALLECDDPDRYVMAKRRIVPPLWTTVAARPQAVVGLVVLSPYYVIAYMTEGIRDYVSERRGRRLQSALDSQGLHLGRELTDAVEAELRARDFEVVRLTRPPGSDAGLLDDDTTMVADADAILDVTITAAGLASAGSQFATADYGDYHAIVAIKARLVRVADHALLYEGGTFFTTRYLGETYRPGDDGKYIFGTMGEITNRPDKLAQAIRAAEKPLAVSVVRGLE